MLWFHLILLIIFVVIGSKIGGIGIGLTGGAGVLALAATGLHTDVTKDVPWGVIGIIMPVICAIAALQVAGGMDYLVHLTEILLRKHPRQINYLAPFVTFMLTVLCGTGHTAYSVLPVIVDVSKENGIRPSRPLSIAVVASQLAIVASPISAATVAMVAILSPLNVGYLQILAVTIPTVFIGCMVGALVAARQGKELADDPVYQDRLARGLVAKSAATHSGYKPKASAIPSLIVFMIALLLAVVYATAASKQIGLISNPPMEASAAIMVIMLSCAAIICFVAKIPAQSIPDQSTFKAGMTASICILGVAWLGNMFVNNYMDAIKGAGADVLQQSPWLLAVILYFASPLLFSHAATTVAFMPVAVKLGLSAVTLLACYPAVSNYYLLPNYPTTVAAMEMDDTGSTRLGRTVFSHSFVLPGTVAIVVAVLLNFVWAPIVVGV
nr:anaerobic C4-dicarboxylate transporter [Arcanobacterium pluranimalium]